jgi:UDP-N-acetylglucosamine/UDP-N-acetyl-alpha-D-glucosaminouronate 4-epimerase
VKLLVTGGAGFIGSHLVRGLLARGDSVRVFDDFSSGKRENLVDIQQDVEVIEGDVRDAARARAACEGIEGILHEAAIGSVPLSIEDPRKTHDVNLNGTIHLLIAARDLGIQRFVFASSSSVYGDRPEPVKREDLPLAPCSPYAVSKLAAEAYTLVFSHVYGVQAVALRYFNVYGPRQDPSSMYAAVVPRFVTSLLQGEPPTIFGDGGQTRDFTYVEDVVRANLLALECPPESCGKAYNIACGQATSINELFRSLREEVGGKAEKLKPQHAPVQKGDVRDSLASIDAARDGLGFVPTVGIDEGLRLTVEWYRSRQPR